MFEIVRRKTDESQQCVSIECERVKTEFKYIRLRRKINIFHILSNNFKKIRSIITTLVYT